MRIRLSLTLIVILNIGCGQSNSENLIYSKKITEEYIYNVYETKDSIFYNSLTPKGENFEIHNDINDPNIPQKWTQVILFESSYYLNYPSDHCNRYRKIITDSKLFEIQCGETYPRSISSIQKVSEKRNCYMEVWQQLSATCQYGTFSFDSNSKSRL